MNYSRILPAVLLAGVMAYSGCEEGIPEGISKIRQCRENVDRMPVHQLKYTVPIGENKIPVELSNYYAICGNEITYSKDGLTVTYNGEQAVIRKGNQVIEDPEAVNNARVYSQKLLEGIIKQQEEVINGNISEARKAFK